ncbi:hypothetical protein FKR81_12740 [Lentzea tibetensis]|uniref:Uncharacterized protein n=1 Tax=Lentzea tibetensis TaxID=2591470 RepID=A0A563EVM6_9PSEU|nr:hypothetical protein [Lentzea tibetensis]TWP51729.1 hypothetical protein FKR81_12740 [Lentzea tibetensis]
MIKIDYTLHCDDGEIQYEEKRSEHVPRVGELVTFDFDHSYQVVDVLWHLVGADGHHVTVTACELNWHKNIDKILTAWHVQNAER